MPRKKKKSKELIEETQESPKGFEISKNMIIYLPSSEGPKKKVVLTEGQYIESGKTFSDVELDIIKKAQGK